MTMRLSISSLAGTARTLVAVGHRAATGLHVGHDAGAAPRSGLTSSWLTGPVAFGACGLAGLGCSAWRGAPASLSSGLSATAVSVFGVGRRRCVACGCRSVADDGFAVGGAGAAGRLARPGAAALGAASRRARCRAAGCGGRQRSAAVGAAGHRARCRARRPPAGSPRRTTTTPCRRSSCRSCTAHRARPRATRSARRPPWGRWSGTGRARRIRLFRSVD